MSVLSIRIEEGLDQLLGKKRREETLEALEDIRIGSMVDGKIVHARLESWGTGRESGIIKHFYSTSTKSA